MATNKKNAVTDPEVTQAEDLEKGANKALEQENESLKDQMKEMQTLMQQMMQQMSEQQTLIQRMASGEKIKPPRPLTQADKDWIIVQDKAKEAADNGIDPWTVEVEIYVPHRDPGEDKWYWININDHSAQIPANDSRQKMKLPFAVILADTLKAKRREEDFQDSVVAYDPVTNPHTNKL